MADDADDMDFPKFEKKVKFGDDWGEIPIFGSDEKKVRPEDLLPHLAELLIQLDAMRARVEQVARMVASMTAGK